MPTSGAYGSDAKPVSLDPYQNIVEVHWRSREPYFDVGLGVSATPNSHGESCDSPYTGTTVPVGELFIPYAAFWIERADAFGGLSEPPPRLVLPRSSSLPSGGTLAGVFTSYPQRVTSTVNPGAWSYLAASDRANHPLVAGEFSLAGSTARAAAKCYAPSGGSQCVLFGGQTGPVRAYLIGDQAEVVSVSVECQNAAFTDEDDVHYVFKRAALTLTSDPTAANVRVFMKRRT